MRTVCLIFVLSLLLALPFFGQATQTATISGDTYVILRHGAPTNPPNSIAGNVRYLFSFPDIVTGYTTVDVNLLFGVPENVSPHGVWFSIFNPPCTMCYKVEPDKDGTLKFGMWYDGEDIPGQCTVASPCAFVGTFLGNAIQEEDSFTSDGLELRKFSGEIQGKLLLQGLVYGTDANPIKAVWFTQTNASPPNANSTGAGGLDVIVPPWIVPRKRKVRH